MKIFIDILRFLPVAESLPYFILYYIMSVIRMFRTKSSNDVSIVAWVASTVVYSLYIIYGALIVQEWQYLFSVILGTIGSASVLGVAIYFRIKSKKNSIEENK